MEYLCLWWPFGILGLAFFIPVLTRFIIPVLNKRSREFRYKRAVHRLREIGKTARATVYHVAPGERTHRALRPITRNRDPFSLNVPGQVLVEEYYTPDDGKEWAVSLKIQMTYLSDIEVKRTFVLSRKQYMQLVPGKMIDVILDPADPTSVEILWDRQLK